MREADRTFKDFVVWQRAHQFVLAIYKITETFPRHDLYGLVSQIRRASVSIAANIAEGFRKRTSADSDLDALLTEVSKLLHAYRNSILNSNS